MNIVISWRNPDQDETAVSVYSDPARIFVSADTIIVNAGDRGDRYDTRDIEELTIRFEHP